MASFGSEWDYYLQGYRLNQGLSEKGNGQAQKLLKDAAAEAIKNGSRFGRPYGLLAFTIQNAWLSDWIVDVAAAVAIRTTAISVISAANSAYELSDEALNELNSSNASSVDSIIKAVIKAYAETAVNLDGDDFDNKWSWATALLYNKSYDEAVGIYRDLHNQAGELQVPQVIKSSIDVDFADALFFGGDPSKTDEAAINEAIGLATNAITANPDDPKRHRWNWTLGWAYYELGHIVDRQKNCFTALEYLEKIRTPHDLILKNLMAAYVGSGQSGLAIPLANDFKLRNPRYSLLVEQRWPYRDAQLGLWVDDLRTAGLPDEP